MNNKRKHRPLPSRAEDFDEDHPLLEIAGAIGGITDGMGGYDENVAASVDNLADRLVDRLELRSKPLCGHILCTGTLRGSKILPLHFDPDTLPCVVDLARFIHGSSDMASFWVAEYRKSHWPQLTVGDIAKAMRSLTWLIHKPGREPSPQSITDSCDFTIMLVPNLLEELITGALKVMKYRGDCHLSTCGEYVFGDIQEHPKRMRQSIETEEQDLECAF